MFCLQKFSLQKLMAGVGVLFVQSPSTFFIRSYKVCLRLTINSRSFFIRPLVFISVIIKAVATDVRLAQWSLSCRSFNVGAFSNPYEFSSPMCPMLYAIFFPIDRQFRISPLMSGSKRVQQLSNILGIISSLYITDSSLSVESDGTAKFMAQSLGMIAPPWPPNPSPLNPRENWPPFFWRVWRLSSENNLVSTHWCDRLETAKTCHIENQMKCYIRIQYPPSDPTQQWSEIVQSFHLSHFVDECRNDFINITIVCVCFTELGSICIIQFYCLFCMRSRIWTPGKRLNDIRHSCTSIDILFFLLSFLISDSNMRK